MEALAKSMHIRQSVKKIRFSIELVNNLSAENAIKRLKFINKKSAKHINKTITVTMEKTI